MSFLSEMQPVWQQEVSDQEEYELLPQRTWTEVKLPNIPIELPANSPPSPKSRTVSRATRRASESCLYCNNQACKTRHQDTEVARVKSSVSRSRMQKDTTTATVKNLFQSVDAQTIALPRPRLDSSQGSRLKPKELNTEKGNKISNNSWEPFSCICQNCGEKFGKHSIEIHQKRCSKQPKSQIRQYNSIPNTAFEGTPLNTGMQKVATIVTMGLASGPEKTTVYAAMPPRPETRTIRHSTLRSSGIGMPKSTGGKFKKTELSIQCDRCQQIVATDRLAIHKRLCIPNGSSISSCDVVFPSNFLRVDEPPKEMVTSPQRRGKPPSKVCYICGREFGSLSIAIHEPQCLKKWQTENRKLPISERKPLPKKNENKPTILRALSTEEPEILKSLPDGIYKDEGLTERIVQRYYQNCYSQFEQDLVPCKKCGRKFAPDRIKLHQPNCNAKPLVKKLHQLTN